MPEEANQQKQQIRVVCTECRFSQVVQRGGEKAAMVIIEHGRETGHKLVTEEANAT